MSSIVIHNQTHPLRSPLEVRSFDAFFPRLLGLMFHSPLELDEGILLVGERENRLDSSIHMFFMRMDLTVVWLNAECEVVDAKLAKRWRPIFVPKYPAQYVLEISSERIFEFNIGDRLRFEFI